MSYIPHTADDLKAMLEVIGVQSLDDLFVDIPSDLRYRGDLPIPEGLDESAIQRELNKKANRNCSACDMTSFLGAGLYDHFRPAVVNSLTQRGEFLTAYTPYQPELSQGNLQAIYEFQSMICELTGMEVANASMYDAGTSTAEAALLASEAVNRKKIAVSDTVNPNYLACVKTYAWAYGCTVEVIPSDGGSAGLEAVKKASLDSACVILQYPNFYGIVDNLKELIDNIKSNGALAIVIADPIALALLKSPGECGADIVVGEGQCLGSPMGFGGPLLGLFACKNDYIRRLPGRIVGKTLDKNGKVGYVMTLRTREQDIRREKATSNICTNEGLLALAAAIFMTAVGKEGIRKMAEGSVQKAHYAAEQLTKIDGVSLLYPDKPYFCEFAMKLPVGAELIRDRLIEDGIIAGLPLGEIKSELSNVMLTAVTEKRTKVEIDKFVSSMTRKW